MIEHQRMAKLTSYARKLDNQRKFELGALVIQGGLGHEDKSVILGALLAAKETLNEEPDYREFLHALGENPLMNFKTKK